MFSFPESISSAVEIVVGETIACSSSTETKNPDFVTEISSSSSQKGQLEVRQHLSLELSRSGSPLSRSLFAIVEEQMGKSFLCTATKKMEKE